MTELCICEETINNTECQCSVRSSDCLDVQGSGSATNPFRVEPIFADDDDNMLTEESDGLLLALPSYIASPPRCQAYHSSNQSIGNDEISTVALNSERYDSELMHDAVTNNERITFRTAGLYVVTFVCAFAANATGDRIAVISRNGVETMGGSGRKAASASFETGLSVTVQEFFEEGEFVEAHVKQDAGTSLNLIAARYSPILSVVFRRRSID